MFWRKEEYCEKCKSYVEMLQNVQDVAERFVTYVVLPLIQKFAEKYEVKFQFPIVIKPRNPPKTETERANIEEVLKKSEELSAAKKAFLEGKNK